MKPEFFRHELLQDLETQHPGKCPMLVFIGLWGHCDKGGAFEWKPRMLKLDILPFLNFDMRETLEILEQAQMLERYSADGKDYGLIPSFCDHQRIGGKEAQEPLKHPRSNGEAPGKHLGLQEGKGREGKGIDVRLKPDALSVLEFLNSKTGRHYEPVEETLKPIIARLRGGASVDDLRAVVAKKCREWAGDPKMEMYLRPKTLFNATNFANYKGELGAASVS